MNDTDHKHQKLPFVTLKLAQTLDGNIATKNGDSKWITSKTSRTRGHQLRADADAILVGRGTVMADDPELSVRYVDGCSPTKIVLDSRLEIPLDAKVFDGAPTIFATSENVCHERVVERENRGAQVWQVPTVNGQPDLRRVLQRAADVGLLRVLIEGGSQVAASALKAGLVDRLIVFIAPKVMGVGLPSVGHLDIESVEDTIFLADVQIEQVDGDILYTARPVYPEKTM
mgnify:FL=1